MDFSDAVATLASIAGVPLPEGGGHSPAQEIVRPKPQREIVAAMTIQTRREI